MPRSRGRRPKNRRQTHPSGKRTASWSDPELASYLPYVHIQQAVNARERAGDAAGALDLMERHPYGPDGRPYWAWWRVERLVQVASMPDLLPGWVMSRWLLAQALIHLDDRVRGITTQALEAAFHVNGQPELSGARDPRSRDAICRIMDHDWVFRQAFLYEYGGLQHFLSGGFAPALARQADSIDVWAATPMAAYRLVNQAPRTITWQQVGTDEVADSLNLGAAVELSDGDHVIGRLVPCAEGRVFESAPLPVSDEVAEQVAADPADWMELLARHRGRSTLSWQGDDFSLVTDLPTHVWRGLAEDHSSVLRETFGADRDGEIVLTGEDLDRMTGDLVLAALAGRLDGESSVRAWPCVAAAAVAPGAWNHVLSSVGRADATAVAALGQKLVGPAAELCWRTARLLRETA